MHQNVTAFLVTTFGKYAAINFDKSVKNLKTMFFNYLYF
jgi:hypothetical protein